MDELGYDLMPNTLSSVALQQINISRQKAPYSSNCYDSWTQTNYSSYVENGSDYSLQKCQRACSHSSVLEGIDYFSKIRIDFTEMTFF